MSKKTWVSIVSGTAAALLVTMTMGLLPSSASAAMYEEQTEAYTEEYTEETLVLDMEAAPYGVYEMMSDEEREAWHQSQQRLQENQKRGRRQTEEPRSSNAPILPADPCEGGEVVDYWRKPLNVETYVSSPFGRRLHPVYGYYKMHYGVDLDSDRGDEILAARGGTVVEAGYHWSYGYYVKIDHGDGFVTEYFHMSRYLVDEGDYVYGGDVIGKVGSTGVSTGSHLHFGMIYEGEYVDPEDYIEF